MDGVAEVFARIPHEVRRAGGSLPARLGVLALAVLLNIGFFLPSIPSGVPGEGVPGIDKIVHLVVLAVTVWAAGRVLAPVARFPMGWVVILAALYTVAVELIQLALPQRGAEIGDILAGFVGIAAGVGLWVLERRRSLGPVDDDPDEAEVDSGADHSADHDAQPRTASLAPPPHG